MKNLFINLIGVAVVLFAFYMTFLVGGGYALKQRAKEHGYDCIIHVGLGQECETGAAVLRNLKEGKCATVRVVK